MAKKHKLTDAQRAARKARIRKHIHNMGWLFGPTAAIRVGKFLFNTIKNRRAKKQMSQKAEAIINQLQANVALNIAKQNNIPLPASALQSINSNPGAIFTMIQANAPSSTMDSMANTATDNPSQSFSNDTGSFMTGLMGIGITQPPQISDAFAQATAAANSQLSGTEQASTLAEIANMQSNINQNLIVAKSAMANASPSDVADAQAALSSVPPAAAAAAAAGDTDTTPAPAGAMPPDEKSTLGIKDPFPTWGYVAIGGTLLALGVGIWYFKFKKSK